MKPYHHNLQSLSTTEARALFEECSFGHLACHHQKELYLVPISYLYVDNTIYSHSAPGRKIDLMRKNPEVCFQVESIKNMIQWQSVIGWGKFEELKNDDVRNNAILVLQSRISAVVDSSQLKTSPYWPFAAPGTKGIVFRVHLIEKTGRGL